MGQPGLFMFIFVLFTCKYSKNTINDNSVVGVLGTRTRGGWMVGTDDFNELWLHPLRRYFGFSTSFEFFIVSIS